LLAHVTAGDPLKLPYWKLSAFYFFYFALLGTLLPFWGLYLQHQGFSVLEISQLMAILIGTKIIAPNIWGWLADKTGLRLGVIRWGSFLTILCFAGVFFKPGFWGMALLMAAFSFFWNAVLPQFEVVTLNHLGDDSRFYSRIRLWGSIGFILVVFGLGFLFDHASLNWVPTIVILMMGLIWLSTLKIKPPPDAHPADEKTSFRQELLEPSVIMFLVISFLMQVSHGPYYTFFSIYLEQHHYSRVTIGWLWALGVIGEVGVFLVMHRLIKLTPIRALVAGSLLLATLRWAVLAWYPQNLAVLHAAQLLHAATFGIFHALAIYCIQRYFSAHNAGQGQAIYSAVSFGAGGAVGALLAGHFWNSYSSETSFLIASGIALVATLFAVSKALQFGYVVKPKSAT